MSQNSVTLCHPTDQRLNVELYLPLGPLPRVVLIGGQCFVQREGTFTYYDQGSFMDLDAQPERAVIHALSAAAARALVPTPICYAITELESEHDKQRAIARQLAVVCQELRSELRRHSHARPA